MFIYLKENHIQHKVVDVRCFFHDEYLRLVLLHSIILNKETTK